MILVITMTSIGAKVDGVTDSFAKYFEAGYSQSISRRIFSWATLGEEWKMKL